MKQIVSKFVEKLLDNVYGLTFLGLDHRVALLITLYIVLPGINIPKIRSYQIIGSHKNALLKSKKINMFKMAVRIF